MDIEEYWDAGFVQVSTDGGYAWTSLANEYTIDGSPFEYNEQAPQIYNNLPGLTGKSGDWINMEFDLAPYIGQEVLISFRYMTDLATNGTGWFVDNISIPEIDYYNDCSSLEGFTNLHKLHEIYVDYAVAFINQKSLGIGKNQSTYQVLNIDPFNVTEADTIMLKEFLSGGANYMIIWYAAPDGTTGVVEYTYEITEKSDFGKAKNK
jgi:bacillopeptidase F (M6 metalloprotease family)